MDQVLILYKDLNALWKIAVTNIVINNKMINIFDHTKLLLYYKY